MQPVSGQSSCDNCEYGKYKQFSGVEDCESCESGSYTSPETTLVHLVLQDAISRPMVPHHVSYVSKVFIKNCKASKVVWRVKRAMILLGPGVMSVNLALKAVFRMQLGKTPVWNVL